MAGRERPLAVGARLGGRRATDEEEAGTSTSLSSSNNSSSASINREAPAPMTGPADGEAEVEVELSGLVGKRRRSVRMLDQLGGRGGGDDIEAGAGGTRTEAPGGDESSDSGSGMSMSPDTCYHVNQRSIGSRKPKMLQDIKTHGGWVGLGL